MKKIFLIVSLLILSVFAFGQNGEWGVTNLPGNTNNLSQTPGPVRGNAGVISGGFTDTAAANAAFGGKVNSVAGTQIYITSTKSMWFWNGNRWIEISPQSAICQPTLIGSATWSGTALIYNVTALTVNFPTNNCVFVNTAAIDLTDSAANSSYDRIDYILVNSSGVVFFRQGTAGSGIGPSVDALTERLVAIVNVAAGALTPTGETANVIYNELNPGEWAPSSNISVVAFNSTSPTPCVGTVATLATNPTNGQYIQYQNPNGAEDISNGQYLKLQVKISGAPVTGSTLLSIAFWNGSTQVTVPYTVANGSYGFSYSSLLCQSLVIPITSPFNGINADRVIFTFSGASAITVQLDRVYLIDGALPPQATGINWLVGGNFLNGIRPRYLGSLDKNDVSLVTDGDEKIVVPADSIAVSSDTTDWMLSIPRHGRPVLNKRPVPTIYASTCMQFFDSVGKRWIRDTCNHGGSGGDFIQNQYSATQTAEYKISGSANSDSLIVNNIDAAERVFIGDTMAVDKRFIFYGNSVTIYIPLQEHILHRYSYIVSKTFNGIEDNRAISGTRMVAATGSDSSMENRIYTIPTYVTGNYIFFNYGINDNAAGTDTTTFKTVYAKVIDTCIARGYPLSHIVVLTPAVADNFRRAAITIAQTKGVDYVDIYTYMRAQGVGVNDLFLADGIHPSVRGQKIIAEGIVQHFPSLAKVGVIDLQGFADISGFLKVGGETDMRGGLTVDGDSTFEARRQIWYKKTVPSGVSYVGGGVHTDTTLRFYANSGVSIGKLGYDGTTFTPYLQTFANGRVGMGGSIDQGYQVQISGFSAGLKVDGRIATDGYIVAAGDGGVNASTIAGGLTVSSGITTLQGTVINGSTAVGDSKWKLYKNGNSIVSEGVSGSGEYLFNAGVNNFVFNHLSSVDGTTLTPLMTLFRGTGNLALGTTTDVPSSILTLASTTKGMLAPRMTSVQRSAISSPATGLLVFDTDSTSLFQYTGSAWQNLYNTGGGGSGYTPAGNNGNVQINDNGAGGTPASDSLNWNAANARLDVKGEVNATTRVQSGTSIIAGTSLTATTGIFFNGALSSNSQVGTTGQKLTSAGAGVAPTWKDTAAVTGVYLPLAGGTMTGALLFTDNTLDIGASGATRPRTGYFGTSIMSPTIVGGTTTTSPLTLYATTGVAAAGASIIFKGGTNGGTTFGTMSSAGAWDFASGAITTLGNISGNNIIGAGLLRAAAGSAIQWSGRTSMSSSADGIMSITANSGTANTAILNVAAIRTNYVAKTANYTATTTDETISCSTNAFDVTLPTAVGCAGQKYNITNSGAANTITIKTTSSQTFANVTATPTTLSLVGLGAVIVVSDGANWLQLK